MLSNDETWYSYTLPKEDPKYNKSPGPSHVTRVLTSFFSDQKSENLPISQNTNIDCILVLNF